MKVLLNGQPVDYETVVNLMDDGIREDLHGKYAPCSEQFFLDEYCEEHFKIFGKRFILN